MQFFYNSDGCAVIKDLIQVIRDNKDFLSEIDGAIGDGDHGVNMSKGFCMANELIDCSRHTMSDALNILGKTLLFEIGGSMGPLYGTFFKKMASVSNGIEKISPKVFREMITAGLEGISDIGNAKMGDKTILDTLCPATAAFCAALENEQSFKASLGEMAQAAKIGKDSTKDMIAKIGRAARLGDRSKGIVDAGATSCWLILETFASSIMPLLNQSK